MENLKGVSGIIIRNFKSTYAVESRIETLSAMSAAYEYANSDGSFPVTLIFNTVGEEDRDVALLVMESDNDRAKGWIEDAIEILIDPVNRDVIRSYGGEVSYCFAESTKEERTHFIKELQLFYKNSGFDETYFAGLESLISDDELKVNDGIYHSYMREMYGGRSNTTVALENDQIDYEESDGGDMEDDMVDPTNIELTVADRENEDNTLDHIDIDTNVNEDVIENIDTVEEKVISEIDDVDEAENNVVDATKDEITPSVVVDDKVIDEKATQPLNGVLQSFGALLEEQLTRLNMPLEDFVDKLFKSLVVSKVIVNSSPVIKYVVDKSDTDSSTEDEDNIVQNEEVTVDLSNAEMNDDELVVKLANESSNDAEFFEKVVSNIKDKNIRQDCANYNMYKFYTTGTKIPLNVSTKLNRLSSL